MSDIHLKSSGKAKKLFKKALYAPKLPIQTIRSNYDAFFYSPYIPNRVDVSTKEIAGISVDVLNPELAITGRVMLYAHGGSFISGSKKASRTLCALIAHQAGAKLFLPDYALAPEHPFPAALENLYTVYASLIDKFGFSPSNIILSGDGAGGGLALALVHYLHEKKIVKPAGLALISPWADLTVENMVKQAYGKKDPLFTKDIFHNCALQYTYSNNLKNPLVSPLFGNFSDFPPVFIQCGQLEMLSADASEIVKKIEAAGGSAEFDIWENRWHLFQAMEDFVPDAHLAIERFGAWIKKLFKDNE
ncbi:alpha/beta hydrolase [Treponema phagedenis]|uniref:Alpha/beta hydrolase n=1 Tax=Treponema phagedenis TaxID=162 RepID=A0A0B7GWL1_TREPH|nr:alpha/beta hydrolase [Treponema phagedenis]NVP25207.1 alpha/beta hydrolase [Treponema phagedenis]NVP25523.1 alpha/beta hydrolase [Treponema phagedenis]QEJ95931.1 alpha/beta hydrolase [Treponema phagedenis]QEJ97325.1 alpha/beta hydrolase [Treponema phagedenis]QEK00370.1 alpha/beta hydrolase [Treponema phagedenis]